MADMTVANTIADQMGGTRRLKAFLGANKFLGDEKSLMFNYKGAGNGRWCKVTLNSMDTYDVEFIKVRGANRKVETEINGVYCDMLVDVFETETKLFLSF